MIFSESCLHCCQLQCIQKAWITIKVYTAYCLAYSKLPKQKNATNLFVLQALDIVNEAHSMFCVVQLHQCCEFLLFKGYVDIFLAVGMTTSIPCHSSNICWLLWGSAGENLEGQSEIITIITHFSIWCTNNRILKSYNTQYCKKTYTARFSLHQVHSS